MPISQRILTASPARYTPLGSSVMPCSFSRMIDCPSLELSNVDVFKEKAPYMDFIFSKRKPKCETCWTCTDNNDRYLLHGRAMYLRFPPDFGEAMEVLPYATILNVREIYQLVRPNANHFVLWHPDFNAGKLEIVLVRL
jgi:hypothetical protein